MAGLGIPLIGTFIEFAKSPVGFIMEAYKKFGSVYTVRRASRAERAVRWRHADRCCEPHPVAMIGFLRRRFRRRPPAAAAAAAAASERADHPSFSPRRRSG